MITPVVLNGKEMLLCATHRKLAKAEEVRDKVSGARWQCYICTVHRRLQGGDVAAESVLIDSDSGYGTYVVTRVPTGVAYCTCMNWMKQRLPPSQRWCKHMSRPEAAHIVKGSTNAQANRVAD